MEFNIHLCIAAFLSSIVIASSYICSIESSHYCSYVVVCEGHAGGVDNPSCNSDPNVTFKIRHADVDTLTNDFFGYTNFGYFVRTILADNNNWPNIEAFAFKYYPRSITLDLANNNIKNIKNDAFRTLYAMQLLNLSRNHIEHLNPSAFLISDSTNPNPKLTTLDLSNNLLVEISSEQFSNLVNLKYLHLENNRLTTLADDCFSGIKNLLILNLQNNRLTALNVTLINLKMLSAIDLSYNKLKKLSGFEINRLGALLLLNMSNNAIEYVESNCFNQAPSLMILDLSNNKIKTPIESSMFKYNTLLQNLSLYNNSIEHIQDDAFKYTKLTNINLEKNILKGEICKQFNGLKIVKNLDLSNQNITAIRKDAFSTMISLVYLNLSKNHIDVIENDTFSNSTSFNILDISYNNLSSLDFLQNSLGNLTELYLNNNNLAVVRKDTFVNHNSIKILDLSMNRIVTLEQFSLPLLKLQYLNLTGNRLEGVLKSNIVSPSKYLRFLDLSGFNLRGVDDEALIDCPLLARVNLSHNAIRFIGSKNFISMDNLYSLDISNNKLTKLQLNNSNLYNLKALYLNNNLLQNISDSFTGISKILYLDISSNDITEVSDKIFETFVDLRVLNVSNNRIKNFNTQQTNYPSKLMTLGISSNLLTSLNLSYFPDLVNVDLSNNSIIYINSSFFQNLDHLQSINLSFNNLSIILPGTFQKLKILKLLNLSSNHIKTLRYGSFRGLNRTEVIDLSRNGMHDLDVDIFHECTELKKLIIDYNLFTEIDFERLVMTVTKLNALSLGGNPIKCKEILRNYKIGFVRRVEITSIDKVFEEDNVHGIWCGGASTAAPSTVAPADSTAAPSTVAPADSTAAPSTVAPADSTAAPSTVAPADCSDSHSLSSLLLIWCLVLTLLILIVGAGSYIYKTKCIVGFSGSRSRRSTMEFGNLALSTTVSSHEIT